MAALEHVGQELVDDAEGAAAVGAQHLVPVTERRFADSRDALGEAGVVDERVDRLEAAGAGEALVERVVGNVALHAQHADGKLAPVDLGGELLERCEAARDENEVDAVCGEGGGGGAADAG